MVLREQKSELKRHQDELNRQQMNLQNRETRISQYVIELQNKMRVIGQARVDLDNDELGFAQAKAALQMKHILLYHERKEYENLKSSLQERCTDLDRELASKRNQNKYLQKMRHEYNKLYKKLHKEYGRIRINLGTERGLLEGYRERLEQVHKTLLGTGPPVPKSPEWEPVSKMGGGPREFFVDPTPRGGPRFSSPPPLTPSRTPTRTRTLATRTPTRTPRMQLTARTPPQFSDNTSDASRRRKHKRHRRSHSVRPHRQDIKSAFKPISEFTNGMNGTNIHAQANGTPLRRSVA